MLTQSLCPCRNILSLTNDFDFPDQSISRDNYAATLTHLNATQTEMVAGLHLESCCLQDFLEKVLRGLALLLMVDQGSGHHWLWGEGEQLHTGPANHWGPGQWAGMGSQQAGPQGSDLRGA